jgi:hypothetical protein
MKYQSLSRAILAFKIKKEFSKNGLASYFDWPFCWLRDVFTSI